MAGQRTVDLAFATTLEPREAVAYLRGQGLGVSWDWHDTWEAAHARAFVVAKAVRVDVLSTLREAVDRALASGQTRREFVAELEPKLRALGWWGRQVVEAPDGTSQEVQLGSPRRLKTIYDTNMRVSLAAGQYRRHLENADSRPYWQYEAMDDGRTRPSHRALDRLVFRHDDPFWNTHYPPNGFNCRCTVRALTPRQVEREGLHVQAGEDGHLVPVQQVVGVDRRTGEEIIRPGTKYVMPHTAGGLSMTPDPGWNYNPGRTGAPFGPVEGDPNRINPLVGGQTSWRELGLPPLSTSPRRPRLPAARTTEEAREQIQRAIEQAGGQTSFVLDDGRRTATVATVPTPIGDVALTEMFIAHTAHGRRTRFADRVVPTLAAPAEVWLQAVAVDGRVRYQPVFFGSQGRTVVVAWEHRDGTLGWTFYPATAARYNELRRGYLLFRSSR